MRFGFTRVSGNRKTGPIPTTMSHIETCPSSCVLRGNGCYAEHGPVNWHWQKLASSGMSWAQMLHAIRRLPRGTRWRHNVAGDLLGENDSIDAPSLDELTAANRGRRGYTYTHYPMTEHNLDAVMRSNASGFIVNASCDSPASAARLKRVNPDLPVVSVLPMEAANDSNYGGVRVVACPAEKSDRVTCAECDLCARPDRPFVIGFRAHGSRRKVVDKIAVNLL